MPAATTMGYQQVEDPYDMERNLDDEVESAPVFTDVYDPKQFNFFLCCPPYPGVLLSICCAPLTYIIGFFLMMLGLALMALLLLVSLISYLLCGVCLCAFLSYLASWECCFPLGPDWHSSLYFKMIYLGFQFEIFFHNKPTLREGLQVKNLQKRKKLETFAAGPAWIQVPYGHQEEQNMTDSCMGNLVNMTLNNQGPFGCIGWFFENNLFRLPYYDIIQNFAEDGSNELDPDPVDYSMRMFANMYPSPYQVWDDKQSDAALVRFVKNGMGAHRVDCVNEDGQNYYVCRTNMLSALPVRPGFANYGGDAYFDMGWNPVKIVDAGLNSDETTGHVIDPDIVVTTYPGEQGWAEAKFRFRSSMSVLVTATDHLFNIHLVNANEMVKSSREELPPEHIVRRFLMPFTYNTIGVNDNAATNLCRQRTLAARCFAFTQESLDQVFQASIMLLRFGREVGHKDGGPCLDWEKYANLKKKQGVDTEYYRQGVKYWRIIKKFTAGIMGWWYPSGQEMAEDRRLMQWAKEYIKNIFEVGPNAVAGHKGAGHHSKFEHSAYNIQAQMDMQDYDKLFDTIVSLLSNFIMYVTCHHEQAGAVEVYVQDASFTAFKWTPRQMCGTKQTAIGQALLMMMTATPMPQIWSEDVDTSWTQVFEDLDPPWITGKPDYQQVFDEFQAELGALHYEVSSFNETCWNNEWPNCFPLYSYDPALLETSISV